MHILKFRYDFARVNGIYITKDIIMFRRPIELYNLDTGETLATFRDVDEALRFEVDGKTIAEIIDGMDDFTAPSDEGGVVARRLVHITNHGRMHLEGMKRIGARAICQRE